MRYIGQPRLPRILMVDCADELAASARRDGYDVESGYSGFFREHPTPEVPPNLHEKDLLVIDLDPGWTPRPAEELYPLQGGAPLPNHVRTVWPGMTVSLERFRPAFARGALVVCLMEAHVHRGVSKRWKLFDWLAGATTRSAEHVSDDTSFRLPEDLLVLDGFAELGKLLRDQAGHMRGERVLQKCEPLLLNDAGEIKAGWELSLRGVVYFLPHFQHKTTVLRRLLREVLPKQSPELFPERRRSEWVGEDAYQLPAVLEIRRRREVAEREHRELLESLDSQEALAVEEQEPFGALLVTDGEDLRQAVHRALDFLGFEEVIDADELSRRAGRNKEEDLQLKDGDYFAVVEVTSGKGNARERDFNDLLKYRHRRQQDPGRQDVNPLAIRGLLVMNQHSAMEPRVRPHLFEGNENDYPAQAKELEVGLLSTYDLFRLIQAVTGSELDKGEAREIVRTPGLIKAPDLKTG